MARVRFFLVLSCALALVCATALPAGAVPADSAAAVAYLDTQQIPGDDPATGAGSWDEDTGFGLAEFNTTEAVLAVASVAQTGASWDPTEARLAVEGSVNADGIGPLAFLHDWATDGLAPGQAGKLLLLVALPLDDGSPGFDPAAWDPLGTGNPVDLVAALGGCADVPDYGFFGQTAVAMQAVAVLCGQAGPGATETVRAAQHPDGGWSFDGVPGGGADPDVDVTGMAMMALVAGGVPGDDPAILAGLRFLAERHEPDGWWASPFDPASPESTSRAMLGITAAGWDLGDPSWRDFALGAPAGSSYVSPDDGLGALQQADGSIVGPGTFGAAFATAQAVQALERNWLPVATTTAPSIGDEVEPPPLAGPGEPGEGVEAELVEPEAPATLPRTGGPLVPLTLVGTALVATGTFVVARTRASMRA